MKKPLLGILLTCTVMATPVMAQTVTYACQYLKTAGLQWENGKWVTTTFNNRQPFTLTATDGSLVPVDIFDEGDFDAKFEHPLLNANCFEPEDVITDVVNGQFVSSPVQSCVVGSGEFFMFDFGNLTGTSSMTGGGAGPRNGRYKDSLVVAPFFCANMR